MSPSDRTCRLRRAQLAMVLSIFLAASCSSGPSPQQTPTAGAPGETPTPSDPPPSEATEDPSEVTPEASPGGGTFLDDFTDPASGWPRTGRRGKGEVGYRNGRYVVTAIMTGAPVSLPAPLEIRPGNANVEMSTTVDVPGSGGLAGLYCRATPDGDLKYTFAISEDRTWAVFKDTAEGVVVLKGGDASHVLTDDRNTLKIRCLGPPNGGGRAYLRFVINGMTMADVEDADGLGTEAPSGVGLLVTRDAEAPRPLTVAYDDVAIRVGNQVAMDGAGTPQAPAPAGIVFDDDFSSNEGWVTTRGRPVTSRYLDQTFVIQTRAPRITAAPAAPVAVPSDDVAVTATATVRRGSKQALVGVFCKADAKRNNAYIFVVSGRGTYIVAKAVDGRVGVIHQAERRVALVKPAGQPNTLRAECAGKPGEPTELSMFVNGRKVAALTDDQGLNGERLRNVGIYLQSPQPTRAVFDRFELAVLR